MNGCLGSRSDTAGSQVAQMNCRMAWIEASLVALDGRVQQMEKTQKGPREQWPRVPTDQDCRDDQEDPPGRETKRALKGQIHLRKNDYCFRFVFLRCFVS